MSAQDHPPGCDHLRYCARCSAYVGDLATMRAAAERCATREEYTAELETALAKVTAERDEARAEAEKWRTDGFNLAGYCGPIESLNPKHFMPWERSTPTEGE